MTEKLSTGNGLSELRSPESLELAQRVAQLFGYIPATVSATIRSLMLDHLKGAKSTRSNVLFHVQRLYRVPSVKVCLYSLSQAFRHDEFEKCAAFTAEELIDWWLPDQIAAVFGLIYLTKRAKTICSPDEWQFVSSLIQDQANLGLIVGEAIPRIGSASALLVGALPCAALAAIQRQDGKGFKEYRRHLKANGLILDHAYEYQKWGCDSVQIAASLAQMIGLGIPTADSLTKMLHTLFANDEEIVLDALRLPVAYCWITSLNLSGKPPEDLDFERLGELNPDATTIDRMIDLSEKAKAGSTEYRWLEKTKLDIGSALTPKLSMEKSVPAKKASAAPESVPVTAAPEPEREPEVAAQVEASASEPDASDELSYSKVLPELREMISEDEFNSMSLEERRQLIGDGSPQF